MKKDGTKGEIQTELKERKRKAGDKGKGEEKEERKRKRERGGLNREEKGEGGEYKTGKKKDRKKVGVGAGKSEGRVMRAGQGREEGGAERYRRE